MMNGQVIPAKIVGQSSLEVRYQTLRKGKLKVREIPTEEVFSVTDSIGRERIWYFYDSAFGNDLSIDQMRWFIKGEQDARAGYKPFWPMVGGFVVGAGVTIGLNLEVNSLFLPPLYSGAMALPRVHVTPGSITDPIMESDPDEPGPLRTVSMIVNTLCLARFSSATPPRCSTLARPQSTT